MPQEYDPIIWLRDTFVKDNKDMPESLRQYRQGDAVTSAQREEIESFLESRGLVIGVFPNSVKAFYGKRGTYPVDSMLVERVKEVFPQYNISIDSALTLPDEMISAMALGKKKTTVKYKRGTIRLPQPELPIVVKGTDVSRGKATFYEVEIKPYGKLNCGDAIEDGFGNLIDFMEEMKRAYGDINHEELVSIFRLGKVL